MNPDIPAAPPGETTRPARRAPRPLQAAIVLSALYLLSRVVGVVQAAIIASKLKPYATDAYFGAFALPDFINYLVAGGALSSTFIPIFTELMHTRQERDAWRFFSTLATIMGTALLLLIVLTALAARPLVLILNTGFGDKPPATLNLAVTMTRIMLPAQMFFYLGGLIVGVLNYYKRFNATGWTGTVYNVVAIIVALSVLRLVGPVSFAWGILIGAAVGSFVLPLVALLAGPVTQRLHYRPNFDWRNPDVQRFFGNALPIMLGVSLPVVDQLVVGRFASFLPTGALTHLRNGNRVMVAPLGILAQAASVVAFPFLASNTAARDWKQFSSFLRTGLRRLLFLALPMSILLILLAQPINNLLYRHGLYTQAAADETSVAFAFYCVGLFAWTGQQFVARGFYALQDTVTPTVIGSGLTIFFFIPLAWAAARLDGVRGLAMATSIGATAHFVCILLALESKLQRRRYRTTLQLDSITGTLLRTVIACIPMGIAGLVANSAGIRFLADDIVGDFTRLILVGAVASAVFAVMAQLVGIPEWHWLKGKLLRRVRI